uniref:YTH domain-containing family protein n=1 Tax=Daucus carota subsp. sativus TaxID=79200 RepID=A0A175YEH2_DAUCS
MEFSICCDAMKRTTGVVGREKSRFSTEYEFTTLCCLTTYPSPMFTQPLKSSNQVNGSGQYVGLAEMIGQMDFAKIMNFWQRDKWNGFFPVKWHIVKDIPNTQLRHIVIESNDNKPVTHSVGTQEIGLQQGLKMQQIFKSYSGVTSMLDDFNFHENHEQSLKAKRNQMRAPQTEIRSIMNTQYHISKSSPGIANGLELQCLSPAQEGGTDHQTTVPCNATIYTISDPRTFHVALNASNGITL